MRHRAATWAVAISMACVGYASSARAVCVGDCNGDNMVAINELIIGVNIALGATPVSACPSFDADGNGTVGINELITAVNNALGMCLMTGTERVFTLDAGVALSPPADSPSGLFTTGLTGLNASNGPDDGFSPGPLTLVLGTADANGVASLTLKEDVFLRIGVVDGSHLCFHMMAAETAGSIDCDGGTPYDTRSTQTSPDDVGFPFSIETGLGTAAGPGNGNLLIPVLYQIVDSQNPDFDKPCEEVTYTNPLQTFPFTTTKATSVKSTLILDVVGEPFDCANFATPGSGGKLAAGAPAWQAAAGGPVSNVFRLGEPAE